MNFRLPGSVIKKGLVLSGAGALAMTALIQPWEGRRHIPYLDVGGVLTVCDGYTGDDIIPSKTYTDAECDALTAKDVLKSQEAVDEHLEIEVSDKTKSAFISFTYNVGISAFKHSTLLKLANEGNIRGACEQLSRWVFVKKEVIKGLVNRRRSERSMCLDGLPKEPVAWWASVSKWWRTNA